MKQCSVCRWIREYWEIGTARFLKSGDEYPICKECHDAEMETPTLKNATCQVFCEEPLDVIRRCDPGGLLSCQKCWLKVAKLARRALDMRSSEMQK